MAGRTARGRSGDVLSIESAKVLYHAGRTCYIFHQLLPQK